MAIIFKSNFFLVQSFSKRSLAVIFVIKASAGIITGYFSSHIFSGDDSWFYFEMGKHLQLIAMEKPVEYLKLLLGITDADNSAYYLRFINRNNLPRFYDSETMIKLNSLLHFISFSKYAVHSLLFSFIAFCGLCGFYKFFCSFFKTSSEPFFFLLIFTPSLLLWTSGIIKEGLLVGIAGIFIFYLYKLFTEKKAARLFAITIFLFLFLFLIKPYFILLLIPLLIAFWLVYYKERSKLTAVAIYAIVILLFVIGLSVYETFSYKAHLPNSIALKQQSAMKNAIYINAKTFSKPPVIASSWKSVIINSPNAFMNTLLHPSFSFNKSFLQNIASFETYFFLLLLLYGFLKSLNASHFRFNFFLLCIIFIFLFYSLVGFTSATEGTIVRFKTPALIFILALFYSSFLKNTFVKNNL